MGRGGKNKGKGGNKKKKGPTAAQAAAKREADLRKQKANKRRESSHDSYGSYGGYYYSSYPYDSYQSGGGENNYDQESKSDYRVGGYHWVEIGDTFNNDVYRVEAKLGWGHFSTVWLAFDTEYEQYVALKIQKSDPHYTTAALDEIDLLTSVTRSDPDGRKGVVRLLDHFTHKGPNGEHVCMVFDLLGQNLLKFIDQYHHTGLPVKLSIVKHITKQILIGLDYLHACCGIIHTDLKPENVSFVWSAAMETLPKEYLGKQTKTRRLGREIVVPPETIMEYNHLGNAPFLKDSEKRRKSTQEGAGAEEDPSKKKGLSRNQKRRLKKQRAAAAAAAAAAAEGGADGEGADGKEEGKEEGDKDGDDEKEADKKDSEPAKEEESDAKQAENEKSDTPAKGSGEDNDDTVRKHGPVKRSPSWDFHNNLEGHGLSAHPPPMLPPASFDDPLGRASILYSNFSVKLVDLGNACWVNKHFTDDIQTRQYRSPEVILGQPYGPNTDLWSLACIVFELLTDDFLFDPKAGDDWDREDDHLAQMAELLGGKFPRAMAQGHHARRYFNRKGDLKRIKELKLWRLNDVLHDKYGFDHEDADEIADFLLPMLELDPRRRANAHQMLKHPFLQEPINANDLTPEDIDWEMRTAHTPSDHSHTRSPSPSPHEGDHEDGVIAVDVVAAEVSEDMSKLKVSDDNDGRHGHAHQKGSPKKRRSTAEEDAPARRVSVDDDPFASKTPEKGSPTKASPKKGGGSGHKHHHKGKGHHAKGTPPKAPKPAAGESDANGGGAQ